MNKLVSVVVGIMVAAVLALPAASQAKSPKADAASASAGPSACKQAILDSAKTFHDKRVADLHAFIKAQKDLRVAFNHKDPAPTDAERVAFRETHKKAVADFHKQRATELQAFLAAQKTAIQNCKGNS